MNEEQTRDAIKRIQALEAQLDAAIVGIEELNRQNAELRAKWERVPVDAIRAIYDSVPVNNWTRERLAAIRKWLASLGKQVSL
jgi:hypothetical protein